MLKARKLFSPLQRLQSIRWLSHEAKLPLTAEVVIAGGGVIGNSIAYHLQKLGWKDILLLEQGSVGCGTSWHAAGLVATLRATKEQKYLSKYAIELFEEFEEKYGIGFRKCGSLALAQTKDRALDLHKGAIRASECDIECKIVKPEEIEKLNPFIRCDDLEIGLHLPNEGVVNPTDLMQAYLKESTKEGATKLLEGIQVKKILNEGNRVTSIETDAGTVKCDYFINAAGLWARDLGFKSSPHVDIPLHACQHFYIVTKPMDVDIMMPATRDYDAHVYVREWSGGIMCGGFEPGALSCFTKGIPEKFEFQMLEENWDHFGYLMKGILNRYPCIKNAEIRTFLNGPESFTPDGLPYVCRSKEFENYYISAGMSSHGIAGSAGVGKMISELMTYGESPLWSPYVYDVRRMQVGSNNKHFIIDAAAATLSAAYELSYPHTSSGATRNIKTSPIHQLLNTAGAEWKKDSSNWEIPLYFKLPSHEAGKPTFGQPPWLPNVQREMKSCHDDIGIVDLSSDSVFEICFDAELGMKRFVNRFDNITNANVGSCTNTVVVGDDKGCIAKVTLVKEKPDRLLLITKANLHNFLLSWLQEQSFEDVTVKDLTGQYAQFGLMGSKSGDLLKELISPTLCELPDKNLYKVVDVGYDFLLIPGLAEHTGSSWRVLVSTQYSQGLYDLLLSKGEKYNILNVGQLCLESLRVQNFVAGCPSEIKIQTEKNVLENMFANTQHKTNQTMVLLKINVRDECNWPWGGEPVLINEEGIKGHITSIGYKSDDDFSVHALAMMDSECDLASEVSVRVGEDLYNADVLKH